MSHVRRSLCLADCSNNERKSHKQQGDKETSKQIHRQTADNNAGRLLRHVRAHRGVLISSFVRVPPTRLLFYLHSFHLLWGVLVVIVDSCGCLVSARNKYEHHVNSLAMHSGTQTLTMILIIPNLEY